MYTPPLDFDYKYGFSKPEKNLFKAKKGLSQKVVLDMSAMKKEPRWMTDFRLKSLEIFNKKSMPNWGGDLSKIDFKNYFYYIKPIKDRAAAWEDLPKEIKDTYDAIGIPEAEK